MNLAIRDNTPIDTIQRVNGVWKSKKITTQELCTSAPSVFDILIAFLATEAALPRAEKVGSNDISRHFNIPASFWTPMAQEASGFLGIQDLPGLDPRSKSYTSVFRFLIKEPSAEQEHTADKKTSYHWHKAGFFTYWQSSNASVILCFDLPRFLQESLSQSVKSSGATLRAEDPFAVHPIIVEEIAALFNKAVWGWRDLVRGLERNRVSPFDYDPQPNYAEMHEVARHVIHSTEMLEVASEVVAGMVREHAQFFADNRSAVFCAKQAGNGLRFHGSMLTCMLLRSKALNERLKNEINLAINVVAQHDSHVSVRIGEATQVDSAAMKTISILGLTFLPGTFICAVFSMSFFSFSPATNTSPQSWVLSDKFWVFWATAVPVTAVVVVCWFVWQRLAMPSREISKQQKLYLRRPATGMHA